MNNKKIKLIVFLSAYTIFVVIVLLLVINREKIMATLNENKKVLQNTQNEEVVISNKNNQKLQDDDKSINQDEKNYESDNEFIKNIDENITSTNIYDEYGLLDVNTFDKETIESNKELFQKYIGFVDAVHNGEGIKYSILNLEYIQSLYDNSIFYGDSNVIRFADQRILPKDKVVGFRGLALRELYGLVEDVDLSQYDNIILWTGYVIKYIKDSEHYISEYDRVIKKIKEQNENANIYVCSLLPASKNKVEEDLKAGSPHNIHIGPTYDAALEKYYKDQYINTKIFVEDDMYIEDGYHMKYEFYPLVAAYVAFYINLMKLK